MIGDETVRLTYAELARARGITPAAAKRMALRHRWPKQIGNDGLSRVSVPASAIARPASNGHNDAGVISSGIAGDASDVDASGNSSDAGSDDTPSSQAFPIDAAMLAAIVGAAVAAADDARAAAVADAGDDARRVISALEESIMLLREQLATERLLRAEDKDRTDHAEQRAGEAEARVRELQEKFESEVTEHRRVVAMLTEQLAARRSWWPWRRRSR